MERGADRVVMGEREIANSMLGMLQVDIMTEDEKRPFCPV